MKKFLAYVVIVLVLTAVAYTTAIFVKLSVMDQNANWRLAEKGWHYLAQQRMPDREKQAALINMELLNISP